jgi:hypothetical protein
LSSPVVIGAEQAASIRKKRRRSKEAAEAGSMQRFGAVARRAASPARAEAWRNYGFFKENHGLTMVY